MSERPTSRKPLKVAEPEMRSGYDFANAVRGKYHKRYLETANVVLLDPDMARKFRTSASVNKALREYLKGAKRSSAAGPAAVTARKRAAR